MAFQKKGILISNYHQLSNKATQFNSDCFTNCTLEGSMIAKLVRPLPLTFQHSMDIKPSFLLIAISSKN